MTERCKTCGQKLPWQKNADGKFDKQAYQRSYMRAKRAIEKAAKLKAGNDPVELYEQLMKDKS